jgi:spermidine/putrescine transport system permease protein
VNATPPRTIGQALRRRNPVGSLSRRVLAAHAALTYLYLYAPILVLVLYSFNRSRRNAQWTGFTLDWYRKLFSNDHLLEPLKTSLIIASLTTVVCTVAGTLLALALDRHRFRGKTPTQALLYLPIITPEIVMGAAALAFFSVAKIPLGLGTVVVAHIAFCLSYVTVVVKARLAGFDRSLEEAAMDLGANAFETFRRVTLPLILPAVVSGALLVFTLSIDDFVITSFVAGPRAQTLPMEIYSRVKVGVSPEINALSTLMLVFTITLIVAAQVLQREPRAADRRR